jgi:hypothetical protein
MTVTRTAIYEISTGMIKSTGGIGFIEEHRDEQVAAALAPWGSDSHALFEGEADLERHYIPILDGEPVKADRPELIVRTEDDKTTLLADGADTIVLTGLPDPCEIIIDDPDPDVETTAQTVNGGGFIFVADDPGVYSIEVRRWPFLPFLIELTAI